MNENPMPDVSTHRADFSRAALDATGVGTWDLDVRRGICFCDPVVSALYGFSSDEGVRGVPIARMTDLVHPDDREALIARRALTMRKGGLFFNEFRIAATPYTERWVIARGRSDLDAAGNAYRARGIMLDVTESRLDGYVDGSAFFTESAAGLNSGPGSLDRAAQLGIELLELCENANGEVFRKLEPLVTLLLHIVGEDIAAHIRRHRQ